MKYLIWNIHIKSTQRKEAIVCVRAFITEYAWKMGINHILRLIITSKIEVFTFVSKLEMNQEEFLA